MREQAGRQGGGGGGEREIMLMCAITALLL